MLFLQFLPDRTTSTFDGFLPASPIDQDSSHRFRCCSKEMGAVLKVSIASTAQAQPGFMDQCRRLERVPCCFRSHLLCRNPLQLTINQSKQLLGGLLIAALDAVEDLSHVGHRIKD